MTDTLVYWHVKARGWPAAVLASFGGVPLNWDSTIANAWPNGTEGKANTPFGQLPYIKTEGHVYAQSGAIFRIIARKAGLEGGSDHEFALNQQLIEEFQDIYGFLAKPVYMQDAGAKAAAVRDILDKTVPQHLGYLEKLVGPNGQFSPNRLLVGDVLVICALNIILSLAPKALEGFPKLHAFYEKNHKAVLGPHIDVPQYIKY